jgi:putative peptidoglycan lipid II flippase
LSAPEKTLRSSARSTGIVMLSTLVSRLLGFVRIGIISAIFGGNSDADIINFVFNIPNNLRKLLAEGALSTAFVPVLSRNLIKDPSRSQSREIVRNLLGFQLLVLLPFSIISAAFPELIINLLLNFDNPESQMRAANLFRLMAHYILLISISAVLMGTLNSNERFVIPGLTPLMFSVAVISSLLLFHRSLGIYAMAVGVLAGGVAQVMFQLPQFLRLGYRFSFSLDFSNPDFRAILRNWVPVLLTSGVFAINQFIASRFASEMEVGSGTAMQNAIVFLQLPYGIFSASIITVLYPRLSKQIGAEQREEAARTVEFGMSSLFTFLVPATLGLMMMGPELISVALQRGAYTSEHSLLAAQVLFWYSPGLVFMGINNFLQRLCFSDGDLRLPVYNAIIITVVDIALSLWLKETALRVRGLALANSLSYVVAGSWLFIKSRKRFPQIRFRPIILDMVKVLVSMIPAAVIILGGQALFGDYWIYGSTLSGLLKFMAVAIPAMAAIFLMYLLFKLRGVYLLLKRQ